MRRFLLSLLFVGALSAVFSFCAFADTDYVDSPYMGSGQSVFNHKASYSVSASAGDVYYFDVSVSKSYDTILTPSGTNIASQVYNDSYDYSVSIQALGVNYGAGTVQTEGNRVWVFFDRPVSSVTITYQVTITYSWKGGTFNGSPAQDLTQCVARCPFNVSAGSFNRTGSGYPNDITISDQLNKVLDALGASPTYPYLQDAIWYISSQYFQGIWTNTAIVANTDGYFVLNDGDYQKIILGGYGESISYTLSPGSYIFSASFYADAKPTSVSVCGVTLTDLQVQQDWNNSSLFRVAGVMHVQSIVAGRELVIQIDKNFSSGIVYGGLAPYSTDAIAGDALNPDQDGMVSDVDDAGEQQSQQEDQMWQNINTYKGDISFNLDGWDDAAGGLSYVTGVFMTIWNNSPTQPIVLSLMLGIAMLSIGRGVMAAVRVSRNRGDD